MGLPHLFYIFSRRGFGPVGSRPQLPGQSVVTASADWSHILLSLTIHELEVADMTETHKGATNNERLLAAARQDNEEMLLEVFEQGDYDINFQDGLGNTALHYAASLGNTDVLEHILSQDNCDVDPINRLEGATPLHLALKLEDKELRHHVVESLLEAGADTTIKDKEGDTALDLVPAGDEEILTLIRRSRAQASFSADDVASDDDDGEPGSGSGSEAD